MFKSIQWKILTLFVLLAISVMCFVGVFSAYGISEYYHRQFIDDMENGTFTESMTAQMSGAAERSFEDVLAILETYSVRIGVDSYRDLFVLSGDDASCLYSLSGRTREIPVSDNVIAALSGKVGNKNGVHEAIMDYAVPIKVGGAVRYIAYVSDTKEEMYDVTRSILGTIFLSLLIGIAIAVLLGFVLSKTLIAPISRLQNSAAHMAEGNFTDKIKVNSADEIGNLTKAFNYMAAELNTSMSDMAAEKNKVETILLYMTDGVVAFNADGELIHINPAAMKLLSVTEENVGSFDELFARLGTDFTIGQFLYLFKEPVERSIDYGDRHFMAYLAPLVSENKVGGVVAVFQDYTKQQKLDNARREFVANVSHELRTPITVVKSYAETLMDYREHDETEEHFLTVIDSETDRMTRLINDLLTLSRLDNRTELKKTEFSLTELLRSVCERLSIEAGEHRQTLVQEIGDVPLMTADRDRIEQVVINIIGNALKYTPDGGTVRVSCKADGDRAHLTVSDSGIGIPAEDLPRIFERFYRVDKARSRAQGGTGLGLAIAKEIVDAHGGDIRIESAEGKGTSVYITLPLTDGNN